MTVLVGSCGAVPTPHFTGVEVRNVKVGRVLSDVSLQVSSGACVGVVGINGAGKSTLMAMMAGVLAPDSGRCRIDGSFAYLPEGGPGDPGVRVATWLRWSSMLPGWDAAFATRLAEDFALDPKKAVGAMSQGQRVRLALVMTLGRNVPLYLLDDPFLGLDPVARTVAERAIAERSATATVVMAAQHLEVIDRLCTDLALLHEGRVVWCAPIDAWRQRFRAIRIRVQGALLDNIREQIVSEKTTRTGVELFLDDPSGHTDRFLGTVGVEVERLALPLDEIVTQLVQDAQGAAAAPGRSTSGGHLAAPGRTIL